MMPGHGDTWIVIGASSSVPAFTDAVRARNPGACSITCNAGIDLLGGWPLDYYFLSDQNACRTHAAAAYELQGRGTQLITLKRLPSALETRGVDRFDVFLEVHSPATETYLRGATQDVRFSRLFCTQFALNEGAGKVIFLGMEKYPERIPHAKKHNELYVQPFLQSVLRACPEVAFEFCGRPGFYLSAPNLRIFTTLEAYEEHYANSTDKTLEALSGGESARIVRRRSGAAEKPEAGRRVQTSAGK
jgi:hypothetical protein